MTKQNTSWILIDTIISQFLSESEQGENKRYKIFQLAFRGMEEMGLDFFYQIKSVKLPKQANSTFLIPADCVQYSKFGVLNSTGELVCLKRNDNLTTYADLSPDRLQKVEDNAIGDNWNAGSNVFCNYYGGEGLTNIYGIPSGSPFIGTFKVDNANGVIIVGSGFAYDYAVLEYVATPMEDGEYYVPIQFREALIAYLSWGDIRSMSNSRKGSIQDKRDRKKEYYNQRRLANARYKPFHLNEARQISLENTRLTVKA